MTALLFMIVIATLIISATAYSKTLYEEEMNKRLLEWSMKVDMEIARLRYEILKMKAEQSNNGQTEQSEH